MSLGGGEGGGFTGVIIDASVFIAFAFFLFLFFLDDGLSWFSSWSQLRRLHRDTHFERRARFFRWFPLLNVLCTCFLSVGSVEVALSLGNGVSRSDDLQLPSFQRPLSSA